GCALQTDRACLQDCKDQAARGGLSPRQVGMGEDGLFPTFAAAPTGVETSPTGLRIRRAKAEAVVEWPRCARHRGGIVRFQWGPRTAGMGPILPVPERGHEGLELGAPLSLARVPANARCP